MNKEDIIQMAREAQMPFYWESGEITYLDKLEHFAKLVAEHEPVIDKSAAIRIATALGWTPPRQWVGLTPQERDEINEQVYGAVPHHVAFHAAIEARLKAKNT